MAHELRQNSILFTDNRALLDIPVIHAFLAASYWSHSIPRPLLEKAIANSLPFGVYDTSAPARQVGFARVISDLATYAYIADVFILESHRGRGLSKLLMDHILAHPDLQGLRRVCLLTRDAQGLYEKCGFGYLDDPRSFMHIARRDMYRAQKSQTAGT
jgi:N-acetylglutamate synthase-like GNAT family acetyltransferase